MFRGAAEGFSTVIAGKSYTHNLHATDFSVQIVPTSSSALGHMNIIRTNVIAGKSYTHNLHATDFSVQIVPTSSSALGHIFWPSGGRGHMQIQPCLTGGFYY